jgi:hypothetical protein
VGGEDGLWVMVVVFFLRVGADGLPGDAEGEKPRQDCTRLSIANLIWPNSAARYKVMSFYAFSVVVPASHSG